MSMEDRRLKRLQLVSSIVIPTNDQPLPKSKLHAVPTSIHPLLDPYLTVGEIRVLLVRNGWMELTTSDTGKLYCYMANQAHMKSVISEWLKSASFMNDLTDDMKIVNTGEDYI